MGDNVIDYQKIGLRIRKRRKELHLSQEELAERVWISVTHMSHIETGSTKLSLPVLVDLSRALEISTDELLFGAPEESVDTLWNELQQLLCGCTAEQAKVVVEIAKAAKAALEKLG